MARRKRKKNATRRRLHQEPIVREVARLLDTGTPTKYRWSSDAHHGLRAAMCLKGEKWARADSMAGQIVTLALHRIGCSHRPSWQDGQPDAQEVEYSYCCSCGGFMVGGNDRPWCSLECYRTKKERDRYAANLRADEARRRATRVILTGGTETAQAPLERLCRKCGKLFEPTDADKRYCSRSCAAKRVKYRARECLSCAAPFQPHQHKQITCGPACWEELNSRRRREQRIKKSYEKSCKICGRAFTGRRSTAVLCGRDECRRLDHTLRCRSLESRQREQRLECEAPPASPEPTAVRGLVDHLLQPGNTPPPASSSVAHEALPLAKAA